MMYLAIKKMLRDVTGLSPEAVGHSAIDGVIRRKLRQLNISDVREYEAMLKLDGDAFQELIESVVVPETWFFRDEKPFEALVEFVAGKWRRNHGGVLRILSVPCAGGEEPYSIAMALKMSGIPGSVFSVDAMDISTRAIERARAGVYTANSFRGNSRIYEQVYFRKSGGDFLLDEGIKSLVSFRVGNLMDDGSFMGISAYDAIFCRNLIIYFDRAAQEKAARKIHGMLKNDGLLITGHADGGGIINEYFTSRKKSGSFSYAKNIELNDNAADHEAVFFAPHSSLLLNIDKVDSRVSIEQERRQDAACGEKRSDTFSMEADTSADKPMEMDDCWRRTGVWGDERPRCARLDELIHCRNCNVYISAGRKLFERSCGGQYAQDLAQRFADIRQNPVRHGLSAVIFRLGDAWFGLPTCHFEEVVGLGKVHRLPHRNSDVLKGVVNIRGELYACISVERLLGVVHDHAGRGDAGNRAASRMAIISKDGKKYVFQTGEIRGVRKFHESDIEHASGMLDSGPADCMIGTVSCENRRIGYINVELLFAAIERNVA